MIERQQLNICKWLTEKGLSLRECSDLMLYMKSGENFCQALSKIFSNRKKNGIDNCDDLRNDSWSNPITP